MVSVVLSVEASDHCDAASCRLTAIRSNESVDGVGDGHTGPDWRIVERLTARLRAERSGGGMGRVYTLEVQCLDPTGNRLRAHAAVKVPRSAPRARDDK